MKQKEDFTLIQEKNLSSWQEFADYCSGIPEGKFLFRGQSNYSNGLERNSYAKNEGRLSNGSLYEFMKKNKKLGNDLFNDIQGLRYDIQFRLSVM
jgi:hypothetical protein